MRRLSLPAALLFALLNTPGWAAGLGYAEALDLALRSAPGLRAADAAVAAASVAQPAAATLPDPRIAAGLENLPIAGPERWRTAGDTATMQRLSLMQEVPNRAKREARQQSAQARTERERAARAVAAATVSREAGLAWVGVYHAESKLTLLSGLRRENQILQDTLPARIAGGRSQPADLTLARQDALAIADRFDELARDLKRARAELRRWVGERGDDSLIGVPMTPALSPDAARGGVHRHAELLVYAPMRQMALAEMAEADADKRGDWAWELAYSRRPRYDDMVSFQLRFDLPWQRDRRQQPAVEARRQEALRIDAEREDALRRHVSELDAMLADAEALEAQLARLQGAGLALAEERIALTTASYQSGRGDLGAVLAARTQAIDVRLRVIELEAQRDAVRVRLSTLIAE